MYEIHRRKPDGSDDENLKIQCFRFDFAGNYMYADTDLFWGDFAHWNTYRYALDGSGGKKLEYSDMMRYSEGDRLYFTENWDNTIYIADTACNVLTTINVTVSDEVELRSALGDHYDLVTVRVTDIIDDWLYFDYLIGDPGGSYYGGSYRINLINKVVEKIDGDYYLPETEG